jgi:hypothetical protein
MECQQLIASAEGLRRIADEKVKAWQWFRGFVRRARNMCKYICADSFITVPS